MAKKNLVRRIDYALSIKDILRTLKLKVRNVNDRIRKLEKAGLNTVEVALLKSQIQANRLRIGRAPDLDKIREIDLIATKFLTNPYTTLKAAKTRFKEHKSNFDLLVDRLSDGQTSDETKEVLFKYGGSIDYRYLIQYWEYEEVLSMQISMVNSGISPTTTNLESALRYGFDVYLAAELKTRGLEIGLLAQKGINKSMLDYVAIARKDDISVALKQYYEDVNKN